jgi:hypothetical protein
VHCTYQPRLWHTGTECHLFNAKPRVLASSYVVHHFSLVLCKARETMLHFSEKKNHAMQSPALGWWGLRVGGQRGVLSSPPVPRPPLRSMTSAISIAWRVSVMNWSVSQPFCGSPVLASKLPRDPARHRGHGPTIYLALSKCKDSPSQAAARAKLDAGQCHKPSRAAQTRMPRHAPSRRRRAAQNRQTRGRPVGESQVAPEAVATASSCSQLCPASVAWLHSMLSLNSSARP